MSLWMLVRWIEEIVARVETEFGENSMDLIAMRTCVVVAAVVIRWPRAKTTMR